MYRTSTRAASCLTLPPEAIGSASFGGVIPRLLAALAALATAGCAAPFDLQGHRGARGLAPENTLAGFEQALAIGVTTLELDAGVTKDGVVVVSHDPKLNPNLTRDASGAWLDAQGPALVTLTFAELQRYDVGRLNPGTRYAQTYPEQRPVDGERIPSLASVFERVRALGDRNVRFNIETKLTPNDAALTPEPQAFAKALLDVVRSHDMTHRVSIQSFDWRTLKAVQRLAPQLPTVCLTARQSFLDNLADARWTAGLSLAEYGSAPKLVAAAGCTTWSPYFGDLTADTLQEAKRLRLLVVPWTVNERAKIDEMLDLGVDGLISDRPDRVREAMAERGWQLN